MRLRWMVPVVVWLTIIACSNEPEPSPTPTPEPAPAATAVSAVEATPGKTLIRLQDPLDEPEFYCIDVTGFGATLSLESPLQAHTCKPAAEDELFTFNHPSTGQMYMDAYDLCVEIVNDQAYLRTCSDSDLQRFVYGEGLHIRMKSAHRCLAVEGGSGEQAGGPSHLRRDLVLESCPDAEDSLSKWLMPGPTP